MAAILVPVGTPLAAIGVVGAPAPVKRLGSGALSSVRGAEAPLRHQPERKTLAAFPLKPILEQPPSGLQQGRPRIPRLLRGCGITC